MRLRVQQRAKQTGLIVCGETINATGHETLQSDIRKRTYSTLFTLPRETFKVSCDCFYRSAGLFCTKNAFCYFQASYQWLKVSILAENSLILPVSGTQPVWRPVQQCMACGIKIRSSCIHQNYEESCSFMKCYQGSHTWTCTYLLLSRHLRPQFESPGRILTPVKNMNTTMQSRQ